MKRLGYIFMLVTLLMAGNTHAVLSLDITQGQIKQTKIAVTRVHYTGTKSKDIATGMGDVMEADLRRSSLFAPVKQGAFLEELDGAASTPDFGLWQRSGAEYIVASTLTDIGDNRIELEYVLWDVTRRKSVLSRKVVGYVHGATSGGSRRQEWRRVAHRVADEVYTRVTGEMAYFDSRIVYIAEAADGRARGGISKRLAMMDSDGANHQYLTDGRTLVLTPRFDHSALQKISFIGYFSGKPEIYIYDIHRGKIDKLPRSGGGMAFGQRSSADGRYLVYSVADGGATSLYLHDTKRGGAQRLTFSQALDTSASFSPDGTQLVYSSDAAGRPQLYVMNLETRKTRIISSTDGAYTAPSWSPKGDYIAFTKQKGGKFHIGIIRPDGSGERLLTTSYMDEGASWAPGGRVLVFTRSGRGNQRMMGQSGLYTIDITGKFERKLPTPAGASDPSWSPLLR